MGRRRKKKSRPSLFEGFRTVVGDKPRVDPPPRSAGAAGGQSPPQGYRRPTSPSTPVSDINLDRTRQQREAQQSVPTTTTPPSVTPVVRSTQRAVIVDTESALVEMSTSSLVAVTMVIAILGILLFVAGGMVGTRTELFGKKDAQTVVNDKTGSTAGQTDKGTRPDNARDPGSGAGATQAKFWIKVVDFDKSDVASAQRTSESLVSRKYGFKGVGYGPYKGKQRVYIGPYGDKDEAQADCDRIKRLSSTDVENITWILTHFSTARIMTINPLTEK